MVSLNKSSTCEVSQSFIEYLLFFFSDFLFSDKLRRGRGNTFVLRGYYVINMIKFRAVDLIGLIFFYSA